MKFLLIVLFNIGTFGVDLNINNNSSNVIWIGIIPDKSFPVLLNGGLALGPHGNITIRIYNEWTGKIWARTNCNSITKFCQTGDCGRGIQCLGTGPNAPATMVDIKLKNYNERDTYGINLIQGYNINAKVEPIKGFGVCQPSNCTTNLNKNCPKMLSLIGNNRTTIGCHSSCGKYYMPCCDVANRDLCTEKQWDWNSLDYFKLNCPHAYAYSVYESFRNFSCTATKYRVTFG